MRLRVIVSITAILLAAVGTFAAEIDIPPPPWPKDLSVHVNQPNCSQWTDDCVTCTGGVDGAAPVCSNIGVACQPKPIRCLAADTPGEAQKPQAPAAK